MLVATWVIIFLVPWDTQTILSSLLHRLLLCVSYSQYCDGYASDYDIIFNADKSKFIVFVSPNRRFLVKAMNSCFYIGGNLIENVSSYVHLGHVITGQLDDFDDILKRRNNYIGQVNNVACYFDKLTWRV